MKYVAVVTKADSTVRMTAEAARHLDVTQVDNVDIVDSETGEVVTDPVLLENLASGIYFNVVPVVEESAEDEESGKEDA